LSIETASGKYIAYTQLKQAKFNGVQPEGDKVEVIEYDPI